MSGPLRRTKRSRPTESGEPLPEGQAAEAEGAPPAAETPPVTPEQSGGEPASADPSTTAETGGAAQPASPDAAGGGERAKARETTAEESDPPKSEPETAGTTASSPDPTPAADGTTDRTEAPAKDATTPQETPAVARRTRWRPFRRRPKAPPAPPPPVLLADPDTPAGVDPVEAPMRPPAGRRGRLRRRLRYLRRARELMLRDLGGLLYEVHRSGGGSVEAHATVVGAKVQRIAGLDAEAHALEAALLSPRGEAIVFEPGVGGACSDCGELYGSDAHFCANCGAPVGASAPAAPATGAHAAVATEEAPERERRAFWRRAARRRRRSPERADEAAAPEETPTAKPADDAEVVPPSDAPTAIVEPGKPDDQATTSHEAAHPGENSAATTPEESPAGRRARPAAKQPSGGKDRTGNGRPEGHAGSELPSGDPLMSEESRK